VKRFPADTVSFENSCAGQRFRFRSTSQKELDELPMRTAQGTSRSREDPPWNALQWIDVVRVLGAVDDDRYRLALELLGRVVAMLTRLCR